MGEPDAARRVGSVPRAVRAVVAALLLAVGCAFLLFFWWWLDDYGARNVGGQATLWYRIQAFQAGVVAGTAVLVATRGPRGFVGVMTWIVWVGVGINYAIMGVIASYGVCYPYAFAVVLLPVIVVLMRRAKRGRGGPVPPG